MTAPYMTMIRADAPLRDHNLREMAQCLGLSGCVVAPHNATSRIFDESGIPSPEDAARILPGCFGANAVELHFLT